MYFVKGLFILGMFLIAGLAVNKIPCIRQWHTVNTIAKYGVWLSHTKQILGVR